MYRTLFSIGGFELHAYITFLAIAFFVCGLLVVRENYRQPKPYGITPIIGIWILVGAMIGAKVFYEFQYHGVSQLYRAFYNWGGGLVFYGGLFGGLMGGIAYLKLIKAPLIAACDMILPYVALGGAITRVGCFLNGCCWGSPTGLPWAVSFPKGSFAYARQLKEGLIDVTAESSLPVHPTQLYSVVGLLIVFAIMRYAYKHRRNTGQIVLLYFLLYGIMRFTIEFFRGDSARSVFGMTVSQTISLVLILGSIAVFMVLRLTLWHTAAAYEKKVLTNGEGGGRTMNIVKADATMLVKDESLKWRLVK